ncbi:tyrosine-type recombinase/integrase [Nonomuraea rhizosphaerae]|uniref:tyrosine-type recombinase/integrase n=1 Tax=Nonomuraea rhizosphaerae TaxID=2665663 RepID=UPI0035582A8C
MPRTGTRVVARLGYEHLRRHDLRHTGLTWMADAGVPMRVLRKITGHGSLSTTQRYLHPDGASLAAAGNALSAHLTGRWSPSGPKLKAVQPTGQRNEDHKKGQSTWSFIQIGWPFRPSGRQDLNLRPLDPQYVRARRSHTSNPPMAMPDVHSPAYCPTSELACGPKLVPRNHAPALPVTNVTRRSSGPSRRRQLTPSNRGDSQTSNAKMKP